MGVRIGLLQSLDSNVRVNLRGRKTRVAEQRLHAPQIGAPIEHVRRKAMPKLVRADRNWDRRVPQIAFQDQPDRARGHSSAQLVYEERSRMRIGCCAISGDRIKRGKSDWANAFLSAFAKDAHGLSVKIGIGYIESGQLA